MSISTQRWKQLYDSNHEKRKKAFEERCLQKIKSLRNEQQLKFRNRFIDSKKKEIKKIYDNEFNSFDDPELNLSIEEEEKILAILEEALYKELEEKDIAGDSYKELCEFEENMYKDVMELQGGEDPVVCPICKKHFVGLNEGVIHCQCGVHIDMNREYDLKYFKNSILESLEVHNRQCQGEPYFEVHSQYEIYILYIKCDRCRMNQPVL